MTKDQKQYNGEKIKPSTNGAGITGHPHSKKMNLDTDLIPFTKINSKWITDLNVKHKTIKLLEDNTEENLHNLGLGSLLSSELKVQEKTKYIHWTSLKLKILVLQRPPPR